MNPGQSVTLTATVTDASAGSTGTPTGTLSFYDGTSLLGTGALTSGVATLSTTALNAGASNAITAVYGGDTNFTGSSTTSSTGVTVGQLDFSFAFTGSTSQTVAPGGSVSYQAVIDPLYGSYAGPVSFTVTGLPTGATYTINPSTIAVNSGQQTVTLTIQAAATMAMERTAPPLGRKLALLSLALLLPLFGFGGMRRRGHKLSRMVCLLILAGGLAATAVTSGCGSSGGFMPAPKSYDVTVTATAGGIQHAADVNLEVQ